MEFQPWYVNYKMNQRKKEFEQSNLFNEMKEKRRREEIRKKQMLERKKKMVVRLNKPLFKSKVKKGGGMRVSANSGIKGLLSVAK